MYVDMYETQFVARTCTNVYTCNVHVGFRQYSLSDSTLTEDEAYLIVFQLPVSLPQSYIIV